MLAAAILAAGESRRMGKPKALLPYRGRTFLEHLLDTTHHPQIGAVRVVLGAGHEEITAQVPIPLVNLVVNGQWQKGQLSSIRAVIESLPSGLTDGLIICLVDHPMISAELVGTLITSFYGTGKKIILPTYEGKRGHPVVFSKHLYADLLSAPDDMGARAVVWSHQSEVLEVPTLEQGVILNLNDPDSLNQFLGDEVRTDPS